MYSAMKKLILLLMLFSPVAASLPIREDTGIGSVTAMLQTADNFRLRDKGSKIVSEVTIYKNGKVDKTRIYHVYRHRNNTSLVLFKSPAEYGQKILMLNEKFWLIMPKSRRPIRITGLQKLLGQASVGDISTLTWSHDYQGRYRKTVRDGTRQLHVLDLEAKTATASYPKVTLYLDASDHFPVKADLYLKSGKLAKRARFGRGEQDGRPSVVSMLLVDEIQLNQHTMIQYQNVKTAKPEDKLYDPSYLARTAVTEL